MWQSWRQLLFLHWRIEPEVIQAQLPRGLAVDTFDGSAWLGVVPFFMRNIRIRGLPPIPTATNFLELNLRTYVYDAQGTPGVWFFSLDANSRLAVWGARLWFRLPYCLATMTAQIDPLTAEVEYRWHRRGTPPETASRFRYAAAGPPGEAAPGSLEFFLVERYLLFADLGGGRLARGQVHHPPYRIAAAKVPAWDNQVIGLSGLPRPGRAPEHVTVSPGVDVEVFRLQPCRRQD